MQVAFHIAAQRYTDHFSRSDVHRVEQLAQQALIEALNRQIAFLTFTKDDQSSRLTVALKYNDLAAPEAGPRRDTVFSVEIAVPGASPVSDDDWLYLGWIHYYDVLSTPDVVGTEIGLSLAKLPVDHLVEKILSHIPLSDTAHLVWKKVAVGGQVAAVVIPIPANQLCMDADSRLALDSQLTGDFGAQPVESVVVPQGEFHPADPALLPDDVGHLFGIPFRTSPADQPWTVLDSAAQDKVTVKAIFVKQYKPLDTGCSSIVPPSSAGLGGGQ